MKDEKELVRGIVPSDPSPKAPDFVVMKMGVNVDSLKEWLAAHPANDKGWINMEVLRKKDGSGLYVVQDTWQPTEKSLKPKFDDKELEEIPF